VIDERDVFERSFRRYEPEGGSFERLVRRRDPGLRARVPRHRVRTIWAARPDREAVVQEIERFRDELRRPGGEAGAGPAGTEP